MTENQNGTYPTLLHPLFIQGLHMNQSSTQREYKNVGLCLFQHSVIPLYSVGVYAVHDLLPYHSTL